MMIDEEQESSMEDRLKAIAYEFVNLYERWSEDRQVAAKQGYDMAELVKRFTEQVEGFESLEENVRDDIVSCIKQATRKSVETIGAEVSKEAGVAAKQIVNQLSEATRQAKNTLAIYEQELIRYHRRLRGITVSTAIATSLLIFWLLTPKPILPTLRLTDSQLSNFNQGRMLSLIWSNLSEKEQQHLNKLSYGLIPVDKK